MFFFHYQVEPRNFLNSSEKSWYAQLVRLRSNRNVISFSLLTNRLNNTKIRAKCLVVGKQIHFFAVVETDQAIYDHSSLWTNICISRLSGKVKLQLVIPCYNHENLPKPPLPIIISL